MGAGWAGQALGSAELSLAEKHWLKKSTFSAKKNGTLFR